MSDNKSILESNIITYVRQCMKTFDEMEFSEVDSLVLSAFSYLQFPEWMESIHATESIAIRDLYCSEYFDRMFKNVYQSEYYKELFFAMAASPRYRNQRLTNYINILDADANMQFAAITISISSDVSYVCFRGTDTSFIGWKEDLNMSRNEPIPGQIEAFNYLEQELLNNDTCFYVGGHSKGGNLATFATACVVQKHIDLENRFIKIFSHDGPGFPEFFTDHIAFDIIKEKIHKTLPQNSLVGQILNQEADYKVIQSTGKGGIEQHSPFTWNIKNDSFIYLDALSPQAVSFCNTLTQWNEQLDDQERDKIIDTLFRLLDSSDVDNFSDFGEDIPHQLTLILKEVHALDPETKSFFSNSMKDLLQVGLHSEDKLKQLNNNLKKIKRFKNLSISKRNE